MSNQEEITCWALVNKVSRNMKYKYWKSFNLWQCSGLPGIINSEAVLLQFCALDVLTRLPGRAVRPAEVAAGVLSHPCWGQDRNCAGL